MLKHKRVRPSRETRKCTCPDLCIFVISASPEPSEIPLVEMWEGEKTVNLLSDEEHLDPCGVIKLPRTLTIKKLQNRMFWNCGKFLLHATKISMSCGRKRKTRFPLVNNYFLLPSVKKKYYHSHILAISDIVWMDLMCFCHYDQNRRNRG